jgi:glucose-1-phosphate cytidylyltransferase
LTYGDALSDVNITDLVDFHHSRKTMVTVTAVHPKARFGEIQIENDLVTSFKEKPLIENSWINGGFFVVEPSFLMELDADSIVFEKEPLEKLVSINQLSAFKHEGFWQCMDNKRELEILERIWESRGSW